MLRIDIGWQFCLAALSATTLLLIVSQLAKKHEKKILAFVLAGYILVILAMTLLPVYVTTKKLSFAEMMRFMPPFNLKPFSLIVPQFKNMMGGNMASARQFLGNIVLFIPAGFLPPLVFPALKKWYFALMAGFAFTLFIEVTQMTLHLLNMSTRTLDIDDLILNTFGAALGYVLYRLIFRAKHRT